MNTGFILRRRGLSTDTLASLVIGCTSTLWTCATIFASYDGDTFTWSVYDKGWKEFLKNLAEAPLLTQTLFGFWIVSWLDGTRAERYETGKFHLWSLRNLNGPFDWASGLHSGFYWALIASVSITVAVPALIAALESDVFPGILSLAGLLVFVLGGVPDNPYVDAKHRYTDDRLRIALATSHHEGTSYVLPGKRVGFDAVWTPKIRNEHLAADSEIMVLFQHMRSGRWNPSEPLEHLRKTLALYQEKVILSMEQVKRLASWIYCDEIEGQPHLRQLHCEKPQNVHLIGRDLIFALCHAEYLVFMAQGRLSDKTKSKIGMLRYMSRSGAAVTNEEETHTIGFRAGYEGYKEAVKHIYAIFNTQVDDLALDFSSTRPPTYSSVLGLSIPDIDDYVSKLWDLSTEHSESTFTALYFFTTCWFIELGNVNGFHIFPLRCKNRDGDLVSQQIVWRQAWYSGCIAQLVSSSPHLFALFIAGYLN